MLIVAVKDIKANSFLKPFAVENEATAEREFTAVAKGLTGSSIISQYPQDFSLYVIGEYNEEIGLLQPLDHKLIISGEQIKHNSRITQTDIFQGVPRDEKNKKS